MNNLIQAVNDEKFNKSRAASNAIEKIPRQTLSFADVSVALQLFDDPGDKEKVIADIGCYYVGDSKLKSLPMDQFLVSAAELLRENFQTNGEKLQALEHLSQAFTFTDKSVTNAAALRQLLGEFKDEFWRLKALKMIVVKAKLISPTFIELLGDLFNDIANKNEATRLVKRCT